MKLWSYEAVEEFAVEWGNSTSRWLSRKTVGDSMSRCGSGVPPDSSRRPAGWFSINFRRTDLQHWSSIRRLTARTSVHRFFAQMPILVTAAKRYGETPKRIGQDARPTPGSR